MKGAPTTEPLNATRSKPPARAGSQASSRPLLAAVLVVIRREKRSDHATSKRG